MAEVVEAEGIPDEDRELIEELQPFRQPEDQEKPHHLALLRELANGGSASACVPHTHARHRRISITANPAHDTECEVRAPARNRVI